MIQRPLPQLEAAFCISLCQSITLSCMSVENLPLGQTTSYSIEIAQTHAEGIIDNPVGGPAPQNASLVRLHAPFERISVYWSAVSEGKPPILPSDKSFLTNPNRVFLGGERHGVVTPTLVGHIWIAAGRYDYSVPGPEGLGSAFGLAKCPWEGTPSDGAQDFYIPVENFISGIINVSTPQNTGLTPLVDVPLLQSAIQN